MMLDVVLFFQDEMVLVMIRECGCVDTHAKTHYNGKMLSFFSHWHCAMPFYIMLYIEAIPLLQ